MHRSKIFHQEQTTRAAELGLGAASLEEINWVAADRQSAGYRGQFEGILRAG